MMALSVCWQFVMWFTFYFTSNEGTGQVLRVDPLTMAQICLKRSFLHPFDSVEGGKY